MARCKGICTFGIRKGRRCKRQALTGFDYCVQHIQGNKKKVTARQG